MLAKRKKFVFIFKNIVIKYLQNLFYNFDLF